jgi:hypothetical protein
MHWPGESTPKRGDKLTENIEKAGGKNAHIFMYVEDRPSILVEVFIRLSIP